MHRKENDKRFTVRLVVFYRNVYINLHLYYCLVVQRGLSSGIVMADGLGAKSLETLADKVPLVGESSSVLKDKVWTSGGKMSQSIKSRLTETWIGQKTLQAVDSTLNIAEKPLAFVGGKLHSQIVPIINHIL